MKYVLYMVLFSVGCGPAPKPEAMTATEPVCTDALWLHEVSLYPFPQAYTSREIRAAFDTPSPQNAMPCNASELRITYSDDNGTRIAQLDRDSLHYATYRLYDHEGRVTFRASLGLKGETVRDLQTAVYTTYDAAGREIEHLTDTSDDGYVRDARFLDIVRAAGLDMSESPVDADGFDYCRLNEYRHTDNPPHAFSWDAMFTGCLVDVHVLQDDGNEVFHGTYTNQWDQDEQPAYVRWTETVYSPSGKPTMSHAYYTHAYLKDGSYDHRVSWHYLDDELVRYEIELTNDDVPEYIESRAITRNNNGSISEDVYQAFPESCDACDTAYTATFRRYLKRWYDASGLITQVDGYRQSHGALHGATPYEPMLDGPFATEVEWRYVAQYDTHDRLTREAVFNSHHDIISDSPLEEWVRTYDERDLLISESYSVDEPAPTYLWLGSRILLGSYEYAHDSDGRLTYRSYTDGAFPERSTQFVYVNE